VQTVVLTWQQAGELAAILAGTGVAAAAIPHRRVRAAGAFLREGAMVAGLFAMWQLANSLAQVGTAGAFRRAHWIEAFERRLPLPSEHFMQQLVLPHPLLVEAGNLYYATMHMTSMLIFLVWLFVRHRSAYRPIRTVMALTTLGCLLVQLIPVAPPRMLPGFVDTGLRYGQSVYSNGLPIDQLSAMPSIHVGWAVLFAVAAWRTRSTTARALATAHALITSYVVVVTGNHFWLDGIVAAAIVAVVVPVASRLPVPTLAVPGGVARVHRGVVAAWKTDRRTGQPQPVAKESA
jgi:hypothetical protein